MTVRSATGLVELCERRLGFVLDPALPLWRARVAQAGKVNKAIEREANPLYTWANLELAVELLHRKRQPISSVVLVLHYVEEAVSLAAEPLAPKPIADLINEAIAWEMNHPAPDSQDWVGQLTRAVGKYRLDAHQEWLNARPGVPLAGAR